MAISTLWAATFLYGINFLLFGIFVRLAIKCFNSARPLPWILLSGIVLQFALSSVHISMVLAAGVRAFLRTQTTAADLISNWLSIFDVFTETQQLVYGINNFVGDLILVWRLYVVYSGNLYAVILPLLLALAAGGCTIYSSAAIFVIAKEIQASGTRATLGQFVSAAFSLTASTQIIVTLLIASKIWGTPDRFSGNTTNLVRIFVESAALMAIADIIYLAVWRSALSGISQLLLGILGQLCAIVPLGIAIRIGLGLTPAANPTRLDLINGDKIISTETGSSHEYLSQRHIEEKNSSQSGEKLV